MTKPRKVTFRTPSGIEIKTVYDTADLPSFNPAQKLGVPGESPFTRGIYPTMYRGKLWTMRQYAGFGTAAESNRRYHYLLDQGQTGLSVAFDLPTQLGLDSDHSLSQGEVGKVGVAVDSIEDLEVLFERIPLDQVSVSMTINATAAVILAMYLAIAKRRNIPWSKLAGTIQNDILKEYIARGTYIFPPRPSLRITTDIIAFCQQQVPHWNTISISGYHIREAGATAVQELAFTFADAMAYTEAAVRAGLPVDSFAPRFSFFLAAHNHFFEEIAKFRAARRIWTRLMRERFHANNPLSWKFRFHTQTSGVSLTAQEPENNVVRVTLQALAAVLGGTQSLHTNSRDEALALPTRESAQIALRTQQIIAHESGAADTVDALGGGYFIENLTDRIESGVHTLLQRIADMGGTLKAIESGFIQREIQNSAYAAQKQIESGDQIIVGLNAFTENSPGTRFALHTPPRELEFRQIKALHRFKDQRNESRVRDRLQDVERILREGENLMPGLIEAVSAGATLGEISKRMKAVFGTYQEAITV